MTPRDKLIENIIDCVHSTQDTPNHQRYPHLVRLLEATLKTHYAIGRWVPVEERLPEFDEFGVWEGYARLNNGIKSIEAGQWDEGLLERTTHWLDMDMPSGNEEA